MIVFMGPQRTLPSWKTTIEIDLVQGGSHQEIQSNLIIFVLKFGFRAQEIITLPLSLSLSPFNPILLALERHPHPKLNELSVGKTLFFTQSLLFLQ